MGTLLDIFLVAVLIIVVIIASKKGVVSTIIGLVAFVLAIILASIAAQPVAEGMYGLLFSKGIRKGISDSLPLNVSAVNLSQKADIVIENIPDFAIEYAEKVGLSKATISTQILKSGLKNDSELYKNLENEIVKPIAVLVLKSIMFFILSILFAILFGLIANVISKGMKTISLVETTDAIIGAIIGVVEGAVIVMLICFLLSYLKPKLENPKVIEAVNESSIVSIAENFDPMDAITAAEFFADKLS